MQVNNVIKNNYQKSRQKNFHNYLKEYVEIYNPILKDILLLLIKDYIVVLIKIK
jgi:hypothetical protein